MQSGISESDKYRIVTWRFHLSSLLLHECRSTVLNCSSYYFSTMPFSFAGRGLTLGRTKNKYLWQRGLNAGLSTIRKMKRVV